MGVILGTLAGVGAAIATAAVNAALDIGLLAPVFGAPVFELGALFTADIGAVVFSTLPVVTYEVVGVALTTAGEFAVGALATTVIGGVLGGSIAGAINAKTDSLGSGSDILLEPTLQQYFNNSGLSILDYISEKNDDVRLQLRNDRIQKVRMVSRKKRHTSMQPTVSESVSEELEQQLPSGQSGPSKGRKVAIKTRRLRKKSVKR